MKTQTHTIMTSLQDGNRIERLNRLLEEVIPANPFQRAKIGERYQCKSSEDYLKLPLLKKKELVDDFLAHPPFGTNLTYPLHMYTRFHRTSGTTGQPMRILDTAATWDWWGRCWLDVFKAAGVTARDRLYFAFSFTPSIGFWSSVRSAEMLGAMIISGGGASTRQRLKEICISQATVLLCTPSYALHLAEVAEQEGILIRESSIHTLIHAGEPGGSLPHTRKRLMDTWGASVMDHAGATEIGAWGIGCMDGRGVHVNEKEFIAEVLDPLTLQAVPPGEFGELVLTPLGRGAWPVFRYRTGDIVCPVREADTDGESRLLLKGGIVGRADDMIVIRGVNVFPSAIENLVREVAGISEFRVVATRIHEMDNLKIELESDEDACRSLAERIREQLGMRADVDPVQTGALPRWEAKNKRFVDMRKTDNS